MPHLQSGRGNVQKQGKRRGDTENHLQIMKEKMRKEGRKKKKTKVLGFPDCSIERPSLMSGPSKDA